MEETDWCELEGVEETNDEATGGGVWELLERVSRVFLWNVIAPFATKRGVKRRRKRDPLESEMREKIWKLALNYKIDMALYSLHDYANNRK